MRLQKAPYGLLSIYDLKGDGQNPPQFGESVLPVVDVSTLYGAPQLEILSTAGTPATGPTIVIRQTVPAGQFWRVYGISSSLIVAAATTITQGLISLGVGIESPLLSGVKFGAENLLLTAAAMTADFRVQCASRLMSPVVLQPGWSVQAVFFGSFSANVTTDLTTYFERHKL